MKRKRFYSLWRYLIIFLLNAFIVTCNFYVFFDSIRVSKEMIQQSAILTFLNVILISLLFFVLDGIQRRLTIDRPVKKIVEVTDQLAGGDFKARVPDLHSIYGRQEFETIADNVNMLAEELSGIETLRTDFISNVSHELKTPLAVIENYATMLQTTDLSEEKRQEYAAAVSDASKRLAALITNILKLNKLENQKIYMDIKEYDLGEQLCECLLSFESVWEQKDIELDTEIEENIRINADPELLSLVWNNLLSNAFKFTEDGGKVVVSAQEKGYEVRVTVQDSGCGMDQDTGAHIFDKFYQGDSSHATQGNGLGLALVKRVVDIMDADISVDSELGAGSRFIVRFRRNDE